MTRVGTGNESKELRRLVTMEIITPSNVECHSYGCPTAVRTKQDARRVRPNNTTHCSSLEATPFILDSMGSERDDLAYEEALLRVADASSPMSTTSVPLKLASFRYLAEPIIAGIDSPAFDNSSVDGYGVKQEDLAGATRQEPVTLGLAGALYAGDSAEGVFLENGWAVRILTGAPIPRGVEAVVMQEDVQEAESEVKFVSPVRIGANIRQEAEEYQAGSILAESGVACTPPLLSLAASAGYSEVGVHQLPCVAIVCTGNELTLPGQPLGSGHVWESNSFGLASALQSLRISPTCFRASDSPESIRQAVSSALGEVDVLITTGAVSVGERDCLKSVFEDLGVERNFWGVRIKPGGPLYFGARGRQLVFGLPGNPVSALVTYYLFVRTALLKMMGARDLPCAVQARLSAKLNGKRGKLEFVRGRTQRRENALWATSIESRGSHMMSGLAAADCLIHVPPDAVHLNEGDLVDITPLQWPILT